MNDHKSFERFLSDRFDEIGPGRRLPDTAHDDLLARARGTRQRPQWLALIKEPPMRHSSHLAVGSPTVRVAAILIATLLISLTIAGAGIAGARLLAAGGTIVVAQDGSGTVETITEAVEMAEDGDTILVRPGTYDESVTLTKDITIRGEGDRDAVVVELSVEIPLGRSGLAPDLPSAFLFDGSDATLENLTVRGESARIVISGGAPVLRDLVLDGIGRVYSLDPGSPTPTGLELNDGTTATVTHSVLIDTDVDIETGSSPSLLANEFTIGAIWMEGAGVDPVIRDNVIVDSVKWGISIGGGARPEITGNTILNAQTGIDVQDAGYFVTDRGTEPSVRGNTISGSTSAGISVGASAAATIQDNVLRDNRSGINVSSDVAIAGNHVTGGAGGIRIVGASPSLTDNIVEGATGQGIFVGLGTSPTLRGNTSCNNGENLKVVDGATPDIDDTNEICPDTAAEVVD